jgi:phage shock protein C
MQTRQLRRSRTNRRIAGVCGGLGAYFGVEPTLIRILFVLLALPGGAPGILIYLILWLAMPEE